MYTHLKTVLINVDNNNQQIGIIKPFINESVEADKLYYDVNDSEEEQANSLIYFENTYMKNTGVLYKDSKEFEIVTVLDGTILNIKEDDILGKMVEIEHTPNLRTVYYSLENIEVKVGDFLNQGDVIGISGANNISDNKYNLLFEVNYNGTLINPDDFYNMDASSFY